MKRNLRIATLLLTALFACNAPKEEVKHADVDNYAVGMKEYKKGNYKEAISYFNKGEQRDDQNDRLYFYKALSYQNVGKYDSSIISFSSL